MSKLLVNAPSIRGILFLFAPLLMIIAFYVQIHGEEGPGGGFQAGAIMSSVVLLYSIVFGAKVVNAVITDGFLLTLGSIGVSIYAFVGLLPTFFGSGFLNYSLCPFFPDYKICFSLGNELGVFFIELGVGICVFASISLIVLKFLFFADYVFHSKCDH